VSEPGGRFTLTEARVAIEDCRREYNPFRPHSKLGLPEPGLFRATTSPDPRLRSGYALPAPRMGKPNKNKLNMQTMPLDQLSLWLDLVNPVNFAADRGTGSAKL
jgi:hypothetical protein